MPIIYLIQTSIPSLVPLYRQQKVKKINYNKLYSLLFKTELHKEFTYCITDVAQDNPRSIKAHLKTGFEIIHTIGYGGDSWDIVLWDWNKKSYPSKT
jgi:L-amino acid N-acyltransferase YncA